MKMGEDPGGTSPSLALGASVTGMVPVDKRPVCVPRSSLEESPSTWMEEVDTMRIHSVRDLPHPPFLSGPFSTEQRRPELGDRGPQSIF